MEIFPEALRFLYNVYVMCFFVLSTAVTVIWAATDFEDNPVINTFGINSICVMMDDPPFSLFGSTLWWPATALLIAFETFDYIRIWDHYKDKDPTYDPVGPYFMIYYTVTTAFECLATVIFGQIFATSPTEHLYMHVWPYFIFLISLWTIVLKRYLYLHRVRHCVPAYGYAHVVFCFVNMAIFLSINIANLHGARLWESHPWTNSVSRFNNPLMGVLNLVVPIVVYSVMDIDTDFVKLTLDRCELERNERSRTMSQKNSNEDQQLNAHKGHVASTTADSASAIDVAMTQMQ